MRTFRPSLFLKFAIEVIRKSTNRNIMFIFASFLLYVHKTQRDLSLKHFLYWLSSIGSKTCMYMHPAEVAACRGISDVGDIYEGLSAGYFKCRQAEANRNANGATREQEGGGLGV